MNKLDFLHKVKFWGNGLISNSNMLIFPTGWHREFYVPLLLFPYQRQGTQSISCWRQMKQPWRRKDDWLLSWCWTMPPLVSPSSKTLSSLTSFSMFTPRYRTCSSTLRKSFTPWGCMTGLKHPLSSSVTTRNSVSTSQPWRRSSSLESSNRWLSI